MKFRTRQQIFTKVCNHLLRQNAKSVLATVIQTGAEFCAYRDGTGKKCGIGALIPESRYSKVLEGQTVKSAGVRAAARIHEKNTEFASELQRIHDSAEEGIWPKRLAEFARKKRLKPTALLQRTLKAAAHG